MSYELRDHTADVGVEATGATLGEVFAATADGLAGAMCEDVPETGERFDVTVRAESKEALLFDYLDELIYQRDVRAVLPVENEVEVREEAEDDENDQSAWALEGSARGVPLAEITAREIKAVTYSEMALEKADSGWRAYVVFDV
ncbi:archease [Halorussus halophilus]|uniref:archease n=1 Tax=Halorussus halophilus TaxID=2650975 RepID=UPI001301301D|nr:archease [Halorussus halophilus]